MITFSAGLKKITINRDPEFGDTLEEGLRDAKQFRTPHVSAPNRVQTLTLSIHNITRPEYLAFEDFRNKNFGQVMTVDIRCHKKRYVALIEDVTFARGQSYPNWEEIERTYLGLPDWPGPTGHFTYIWITEYEQKLGGCLFYDMDLTLNIFSDVPLKESEPESIVRIPTASHVREV